jgi:hypothetical protein
VIRMVPSPAGSTSLLVSENLAYCLSMGAHCSLAITKNGITKLAAPPTVDTTKITSEKKIKDEEILKLLELPLKTDPKKKKKAAKKEPEAVSA